MLVLLAAGADVDVKTGDTGDTALHLAAANGHVEVVKMLVAKGADVNRTNVEDCTPAHRAAQGGYS